MAIIYVRAVPGVEVPQEGAPRRYITAAEAVEVEDSVYYRRRVADGDLTIVPAPRGSGKKQRQGAEEVEHGQS